MSSSFSPFPGPVPPENNPPINPQFFQPSLFDISAITEGSTTIVTTSGDHNYVIGQLIRLLIPPTYGAQQLNGQQAYVIAIPAADQVTLPIDSRKYDAFISNPSYGPTPPQIAAIGDINSGAINQTSRQVSTLIPGSFENISPDLE